MSDPSMTDGVPSGSPERHAQTRLDTLTSSPEWGAKLLAGDAATLAEFHDLSARALGMSPPAPPLPAATARSQLDAMASDRGFAEKYFAGDPAARQAFQQATEAVANGDDALMATLSTNLHVSGNDPSNPAIGSAEYTSGQNAIPDAQMRSAISSWHALGINDGMIYELMSGRELATGKPLPPAEIAKVRALRTQRMADPDWVARLQKGGWLENRELTLMSGILMHG